MSIDTSRGQGAKDLSLGTGARVGSLSSLVSGEYLFQACYRLCEDATRVPEFTATLGMARQTERRAAQRFLLNLPIAVRFPEASAPETTVVSHNVSSRGIFFYMEAAPSEGSKIEFTMTLPPEITLTDSMRVDCRGRVVRVVSDKPTTNFGVAATIDGYNSFIRLTNRTPMPE